MDGGGQGEGDWAEDDGDDDKMSIKFEEQVLEEEEGVKVEPDETSQTLEKTPKKERSERIKCDQCPRTFAYMAALNKHELKHREKGKDWDGLDDKPTPNKKTRLPPGTLAWATAEGRMGLGVSANPANFKGPKCHRDGCNIQLTNDINLIKHNMEVHNIPKECCSQTFTDIKSYKIHQRSEHYSHQCTHCGRTFDKESTLVGHIKGSHTDPFLKCYVCDYTTRHPSGLKKHMKVVHTSGTLETCHVCGEVFKKLQQHLKVSICGGNKPVAAMPCPEGCQKTFVSQKSIDAHVKFVHLKICNVLCEMCDYKTYSKFNLRIHLAKTHGVGTREKVQCQHCDKSTWEMDSHMKTYHTDKLQGKKADA
jgi:hypothetical protein